MTSRPSLHPFKAPLPRLPLWPPGASVPSAVQGTCWPSPGTSGSTSTAILRVPVCSWPRPTRREVWPDAGPARRGQHLTGSCPPTDSSHPQSGHYLSVSRWFLAQSPMTAAPVPEFKAPQARAHHLRDMGPNLPAHRVTGTTHGHYTRPDCMTEPHSTALARLPSAPGPEPGTEPELGGVTWATRSEDLDVVSVPPAPTSETCAWQ